MSSTGRKRNWGSSHRPMRQYIALNSFIYLLLISLQLLRRPIFKWDSFDGTDDFAKTLYQNILNRDPEEAVRSGWTTYSASNIIHFFISEEFHRKRLSHEDVVDRLYRTILGRECRDNEKTDQVARLTNGIEISVIVIGLVRSDEYRQRVELGSAPSLSDIST